MSVHTVITSKITSLDSLKAVLQESGISWQMCSEYFDESGYAALHAVEARMGGKTVWIAQFQPGQPFVFQAFVFRSPFRNKVMESIGGMSVEEIQRRVGDAERRRIEKENLELERERQRQVARQRWLEEEQQRRLEEERQKREREKQRQIARQQQEEREKEQQIARPPRKDDPGRQMEEEDLRERAREEARDVLARLDSRPSAVSQTAPPPVIPPPIPPFGASELPELPVNTEEFDRAIGRLHQLNARRKIQEKAEEMAEKHGLSLYAEQVLEDGTIELTLRG